MNIVAAVALLISLHAFAQDDRVRGNESVRTVMDVPGTSDWHLVSDGTSSRTGTKLLIAPKVEDMGSIELQVLYLGESACDGNVRDRCDGWDVSWVWISHVKAISVPLECRLFSEPGLEPLNAKNMKSADFYNITPGKGPQEKTFHYKTFAVVDKDHPHQTSWKVSQGVACAPPDGVYDDAHHKCSPGETTACMHASPTKPTLKRSTPKT